MFFVALATYGYFHMPSAWNQNSRFDLVRAVVERGQIDIDPYHGNTGDKAYYRGHYYSDKAPGTAFAAVPGYALYYGLVRLTGAERPLERRVSPPDGAAEGRVEVNRAFLNGLFLSSFLSVALLTALALALFWRVVSRVAPDPGAALLATGALGFGSLAFPYATLLYGHQLAGALLAIGFLLLYEARLDDGLVSRRRLALVGLALGWACITEFPAAPVAATIAGYGLYVHGRRSAGWLAAGGLLPMALLAGYHTACFGAPWHFGYGHVADPVFARGMSGGLMGLTYPRPEVILQTLAGTWRGVLPMTPVLALGFLGLHHMWKQRQRAEAVVAMVTVAFFVLLSSSYYMWWGGSALGPRHLIPCLAFWVLPIAWLPRDGARRIGWVLLGFSVAIMLVCTAVGPEPPEMQDPVLGFHFGHFVHGRLAVNDGSSNFGLRLGLSGLASLLPLLGLWAHGVLRVRRLLAARVHAAASALERQSDVG